MSVSQTAYLNGTAITNLHLCLKGIVKWWVGSDVADVADDGGGGNVGDDVADDGGGGDVADVADDGGGGDVADVADDGGGSNVGDDVAADGDVGDDDGEVGKMHNRQTQ